jgi:predicted nuclease of predicted toxin-antitoxin system
MLLIDNNLSPKLARQLRAVFPGIAHVFDFGLEAKDDHAVWTFAAQNSFHILTKDIDFAHLVHLQGFPPKVVHLNCGNVPTIYIEQLLLREESLVKKFLGSPQHGLLVLY